MEENTVFDKEAKEALEAFIKRLESKPPREVTWAEQNARRLELGALPVPLEYQSETHVPTEIVKANPERYIIPECLPACRTLWEKGVDTFMVSDFLSQENDGGTWIELVEEQLSPDNLQIVLNFKERPGIKMYRYHEGCINIMVPFLGQKAQDALLELAKEFRQQ